MKKLEVGIKCTIIKTYKVRVEADKLHKATEIFSNLTTDNIENGNVLGIFNVEKIDSYNSDINIFYTKELP